MIEWRVGRLPEELSGFADNTFHACLGDPSYGLSSPPSPDLLLRRLAGTDVQHGPGFLSRAWDSLPPGPNFWREVHRVVRPGALVMAFSHSRTFDLQTMAMRMAGLVILPGNAERLITTPATPLAELFDGHHSRIRQGNLFG